MEDIKYCKTKSTGKWFVFGFVFNPSEYYSYSNRKCIVCYNNRQVLKKRNDMQVVTAPESVKDLLFAKDPKSRTVGKSILDAAFKSQEKQTIIYDEI